MAFHIIGEQDTVLGYRFAGVTGSAVDTEDEARDAFKQALSSGSYKILLVTEKVEAFLGEKLTKHRLEAIAPYVVVVEDIWGPQGNRRSLQDLIYEAVGIRITPEE